MEAARVIAAVLLFTLAGVWSLLITRRLARLSSTAEWLVAAGAPWLLLTCWAPFLIAWTVGLGASQWLTPLVLAAMVAGEFAWSPGVVKDCVRRLRAGAARAGKRWSWFAVAGFAALLAFHAWGHRLHCLAERDGGWWSAGAGWEDQSFHTALATSFALGDNVTRLSYPHVPAWPLGYPFLADFQAGWLHAGGSGLPGAFWAGNMAASVVFLGAALVLVAGWLKGAGRAVCALVLWHFAGGFGIAYTWDEAARLGSWREALLVRDYADDWALELHFHNFMTGVVWPMRVALFGLAVAMSVAVLIRGLLRARKTRVGAFAWVGGVAGALPLVGAHGLVVLACVVTPMAAWARPWARWRGWLAAVAAGAVVAGPQLLWMQRQLAMSEPAFVRWQLGWMAGWGGEQPLRDWATHWAWNTGAWVTLGLFGWAVADGKFKRETLGWWLILVLGQLVVFQPYVFDNIKLFAAAGLGAAAGCVRVLGGWWERGRWPGRIAVIAVVPLLVASGVQSVVSEALRPAEIANAEARAFATVVAEKTPHDALILTGPQLHHPVLVLAGRRVVAANPSGLTLHGVPDMAARTAEAARIYRGEPDAKALIEKHGIAWIVVGPMERVEFGGVDEVFIASVAEVEAKVGEWTLWRVR